MKIRAFSNLLEQRASLPMALRETTVVVDGHNFFFNSYEDSGLTHQFGCDSHRYAAYLRQHLAMFNKANVKCYFLVKGGHENMKYMNYENKRRHTTIRPIFMKNICKEVLEEMGYGYVICEYESKKEITALAQQLKCPVLNQDVQYFFTGLQCILKTQLKFNERDNSISCRYISLKHFLKKHKLTKEKLALFIVLSDEHLFPTSFFLDLFKFLKAPSNHFTRHLHVMYWLSKNPKEELLRTIFRFISEEDKSRFVQEVDNARVMIERRESGGMAMARLLQSNEERAEDWFPSGVADNHVAIDYINLYRSQVFFGSQAIVPPPGKDDAMILSLDIVKYAYDLLTNFQNDGFSFVYDTKTERLSMHVEDHPLWKPDYKAKVSVFVNGWSEVRYLGLLEHFLMESLQRTLQPLGWAPAGARLLLAALLYHTRRAPARAAPIAAAVLLSYVMLSLVFEKMDTNKNNLPKSPFHRKPILSPSTDKDDVTEADCNIAAAIMEDYVTISVEEISEIYEEVLVYPLAQFQHCLSQLLDLNALCGSPLRAPALSRAWCGPLVYKMCRAIGAQHPRQFVNELLCPAPTVLAFFNGIIDIYEMMQS